MLISKSFTCFSMGVVTVTTSLHMSTAIPLHLLTMGQIPWIPIEPCHTKTGLKISVVVIPKVALAGTSPVSPHPLMRGPCGPRKTLPGALAAVIKVVSYFAYFSLIFYDTPFSFRSPRGPRRNQISKFLGLSLPWVLVAVR